MLQYVVPFNNVLVMFSHVDFYGFNSPLYLDIMMEFGDDRDKLTDLIANAIVQRNVHDPVSFQEMVHMQLGYMGIDPDETVFYQRMVEYLNWICCLCSHRILGENVALLDTIEDTEWVNVIYRQTMEPVLCHVQPSIVSIN